MTIPWMGRTILVIAGFLIALAAAEESRATGRAFLWIACVAFWFIAGAVGW